MQIVAFSTPASPAWRWRIVNDAGEIVEESRETFPSIPTALAQGAKLLAQMNIVDRSALVQPYRSTSHLRRPAKGRRGDGG
jgi:hypothetical protein